MIRLLTIATALLLLLGCKLVPDGWLEEAYDGDDDGYTSWEIGGPDCDDANPTTWPGAVEWCGDARDNDCDGQVDEADEGHGLWVYVDLDGDGRGHESTRHEACDLLPGTTRLGLDCDDQDASINWSAPELCNGRDDDCDEEIDEGAPPQRWYPDADVDGFGDDHAAIESCLPPQPAWILSGGDCDDEAATTHPAAVDLPWDGVDADCAGDDDFDHDGDGWRHPAAGHSPADCDDTDPTVFPGAPEQPYDAVDDDCDPANDWDVDGDGHTVPGAPSGSTDDCDDADPAATSPPLWYLDADADGHAGPTTQAACADPGPAWEPLPTDCHDADPTIHPGATERCDDVDSNCDGVLDEALKVPAWPDLDGDGFGAGSSALQCATPTGAPPWGWSWRPDDCDDSSPAVHPEAVDRCATPLHEDCDPTDVEDDALLLYRDADDDTWGDPSDTTLACAAPGYVPRDGDCDDSTPLVHPGAAELCDGIDQNCVAGTDDEDRTWGWEDADQDGWGTDHGLLCADHHPASQPGDCDDTNPDVHPQAFDACATPEDEDCDPLSPPDDVEVLFADADGDGHGDPSTATIACPAPGLVSDATDCDDADPDIHPGVVEICDGIDQNCSAGTDDEGRHAGYADPDGDGWGSGALTDLCPTERGATRDGDCDESSSQVNPGATDWCATPLDEDCDTTSLPDDAGPLYADADGDTWGDGLPRDGCPAPGRVARSGDCDDHDIEVHPTAPERCDGVDQDCDGSLQDEGRVFASLDQDGDGFGAGPEAWRCPGPDVAVEGGDCADDNDQIWPGAPDLCALPDDGDCDPATPPDDTRLLYDDDDHDSFGDPTTGAWRCPATHLVANDDDCRDSDPRFKPGAPEVCDGFDEDCDGLADDGVTDPFYPDADGDGAGAPLGGVRACVAPPGYVSHADDCDDADPERREGIPEICDGKDNDCNFVLETEVECDAAAVACVGDRFYVLLDGPLSHNEANLECASRGSHLLWTPFRYDEARDKLQVILQALFHDLPDTYLLGFQGGCTVTGFTVPVWAWYDGRDGSCSWEGDIRPLAYWTGVGDLAASVSDALQVAYYHVSLAPGVLDGQFSAQEKAVGSSSGLTICEMEATCSAP